jgi:putative membrane protein
MTFLLGAGVGLLSVAHAVRAAFKRKRKVTIAFFVSLVFGALRAPVEQASVELVAMGTNWTRYWIRSFILFAIAGIAIVVSLGWGHGVSDRVKSHCTVADIEHLW